MTKQQKLDSLKTKLSKDSAWIFRFKEWRPLFAIDQRNSFIKNNPVQITGIQLGAKYKERHNFGMGFYTVSPKVKKDKDVGKISDSTKRYLKMGYFTFFWEYSIIDTKRWEVGFPIEIGFGSYDLGVTDTLGHPIPGKPPRQGGFASFGAGPNVTFHIFSWVGLNGMLGYRFVSDKDPNLNFNGAFYSVGLQVSLGQVIRIARYHIKKHSYKKHVKEVNSGKG
jgi:hypothetical protein